MKKFSLAILFLLSFVASAHAGDSAEITPEDFPKMIGKTITIEGTFPHVGKLDDLMLVGDTGIYIKSPPHDPRCWSHKNGPIKVRATGILHFTKRRRIKKAILLYQSFLIIIILTARL